MSRNSGFGNLRLDAGRDIGIFFLEFALGGEEFRLELEKLSPGFGLVQFDELCLIDLLGSRRSSFCFVLLFHK